MRNGFRLTRAILATAAVLGMAGCVVYEEPDHGGYYEQQGGYYYQQQNVHVPPGHMPPPGQCRIWLPDTSPGHQPPSGSCHKLRHQVPPGATLIYG